LLNKHPEKAEYGENRDSGESDRRVQMGGGKKGRNRRRRARARAGWAVSTGTAARCCFVTPDTIVNWIKAGKLPAQRTAGGQYRILVSDLREFMEEQGMSTNWLESGNQSQPLCHDFRVRGVLDPEAAVCASCVVRHLGAFNCFKLMGMRPGEGHRYQECENCQYYQRWGGNSVRRESGSVGESLEVGNRHE